MLNYNISLQQMAWFMRLSNIEFKRIDHEF